MHWQRKKRTAVPHCTLPKRSLVPSRHRRSPNAQYTNLKPRASSTIANLELAFRDTVQLIAMSHWKLILAYDGTPYSGWQIQPNLPTVQGPLSDAIHRTVGERVLPQGSGRTDAGVHALAQVASFTLAAPIPAANLHRALNRCLPPSIRVLSVEIVPQPSTPATPPSARPTSTASSPSAPPH